MPAHPPAQKKRPNLFSTTRARGGLSPVVLGSEGDTIGERGVCAETGKDAGVPVRRSALCRFAWLLQAASWKEKWADARDASPKWGRRTTQTLTAYRGTYGRCKQANRLGGSERGERRTPAMARSVIGTALALRCWWPAPARRCASAGRGAGHGDGRALNLQFKTRPKQRYLGTTGALCELRPYADERVGIGHRRCLDERSAASAAGRPKTQL